MTTLATLADRSEMTSWWPVMIVVACWLIGFLWSLARGWKR